MKLVYEGAGAQLLPDARLCVEPGKPTEIPDDIAAQLLGRPGWRKVQSPAKKED